MQIIDTDTQIDINIESPLLVLEYTADADREIYAQVYLSEIVGNGSYRACITKKPIGSAIFYQSPTSAVFVKLGTTSAYLTTLVIPVFTGDIVRIYIQGLIGDVLVDCLINLLDDNFAELEGQIAIIDEIVDDIKTKTDNLPSDPADQSILAGLIAALPAAPSEADIITALKASVFDGLLTFEDSIKLYNAILFGKLDGGGSGTLKFRDPADTKDRITATVDLSTGDRDDITLDLT